MSCANLRQVIQQLLDIITKLPLLGAVSGTRASAPKRFGSVSGGECSILYQATSRSNRRLSPHSQKPVSGQLLDGRSDSDRRGDTTSTVVRYASKLN